MSAFLTLLLVSGVIRADAGQLHTGSFAFTCAAFPAELTEADLIARHGRENVIHALPRYDGTEDFALVRQVRRLIAGSRWRGR